MLARQADTAAVAVALGTNDILYCILDTASAQCAPQPTE